MKKWCTYLVALAIALCALPAAAQEPVRIGSAEPRASAGVPDTFYLNGDLIADPTSALQKIHEQRLQYVLRGSGRSRSLVEVCLSDAGCASLTAFEAARLITENSLGGNCQFCPHFPEPPPNPGDPLDFCSGKRNEARYLDTEALGGPAAAYNYCRSEPNVSRTCQQRYDTPHGVVFASGTYTVTFSWESYWQECLQTCTRCSTDYPGVPWPGNGW